MYQFILAVSLFTQAFLPANSISNPGNKQGIYNVQGAEIPYTLAKNYFVKNTYIDGQLKNPKITSQEIFDQYFGMATLMGEGGQPTPIDFSKQYVIAVIGAESDNLPTMSVKSVNKNKKDIMVNYEYKLNGNAGYTMRPLLLLIVDKKHKGNIVLVKE
jgi:hypothetical protein